MLKISAIVLTKNEEKNIRSCLDSLSWADEIIIYDSGSIDNTLAICEEFNCKIHKANTWSGFGIAKQNAVNLSSNDWVFVIDADEVVSQELQNYLIAFKSNTPLFKAYRIKRISYYGNKMIRFSGWQKDFTLRLFNKQYAHFNEKIVHESVVTKEKLACINHVLWHYTYPEIQIHIQKMISYSKLGAEQAFNKGKKSSILYALLSALTKFIKMYLLKFGFLDGKAGLVLAINSSFGVYLKYIYLWEKWKKQ